MDLIGFTQKGPVDNWVIDIRLLDKSPQGREKFKNQSKIEKFVAESVGKGLSGAIRVPSERPADQKVLSLTRIETHTNPYSCRFNLNYHGSVSPSTSGMI